MSFKTVREIREERGLSLRTLATKAGVSRNTLARIESGLPIRRSTKAKIAKALKVPPGDIEFFVVRHY